jgi:glutamate formiminotransferase / 5-formyltetrahydrofolate cyclo-ligase
VADTHHDGAGLLECVVNVSEGRDELLLGRIVEQIDEVLLDLHRDPSHHRGVITLGGRGPAVEAAVRRVATHAVSLLDLGAHRGAHPRFGVVDVVPFVPLPPLRTPGSASWSVDATPSGEPDLGPAVGARDRFAQWAATELGLPCFLYGPLPNGGERTLPEVRRRAFRELRPDVGPSHPDPRSGAVAVGARQLLVAYNLWVTGANAEVVRQVAAAVRSPQVRALGLELEGALQVSCNLVRPGVVGPAQIYDQVAALLEQRGAGIERAELVGLAPQSVVQDVAPSRWRQLDIGPATTIESRLEERRVRKR